MSLLSSHLRRLAGVTDMSNMKVEVFQAEELLVQALPSGGLSASAGLGTISAAVVSASLGQDQEVAQESTTAQVEPEGEASMLERGPQMHFDPRDLIILEALLLVYRILGGCVHEEARMEEMLGSYRQHAIIN